MGAAEFAAAGLYDPAAPNAADRLALLEWLASRGITIEQMARAVADGPLTALAGDLARHASPMLTLAEVSARIDVPLAKVLQIWSAAGLPPVAPDEPALAEEALPGFATFTLGTQLFGEDASLRFVRVLGSSLARIAEAAVSLSFVNVVGPVCEAGGGELEQAQANLRVNEALDVVPTIMRGLFLCHMETAIRRFQRARHGDSVDTARLAVGFVDLVGFTTLSRRMEPRELAAVVERFEDAAHDIATARDGRVVKLIGDEAMFVTVDPTAACDIALTLVERFAGDPAVTPRGGVAFGELLVRGGDYYGPIVNLAARLAELAVPGELLVTAELAAHARDDGLRFEPAGRRMPKGFDTPLSLLTVERG